MPPSVEPLILASSAYPRMETLALGAKRTLRIALRIFDPTTPLVSAQARAAGLVTWSDLIAHVAEAGVSVRVLIADFDPLFAPSLHEGTMASLAHLRPLAGRRDVDVKVLVHRHSGEVGLASRTLLWPLVADRRRKAGWPRRLWPPQRLYPATHHVKVLVSDASAMVIGGLDIDRRRWDDPTHARPAETTWHDVSLAVTGPAAAEADRFLAALMARAAGGGRDIDGLRPVGSNARISPPAADAAPSVAFQVTASVASRSPFALGPRLVSGTIREGLVATIKSARNVLYLESQFVRDQGICNALTRALARHKCLTLIIVTPAAPDTLMFDGNDGASAQHAEWLTLRFCSTLIDRFGSRVGVFSLAGARLPDAASQPGRATRHGRGVVYIHAKVMIADAHTAHVSSANLNARSLSMDTEAGILWRDPPRVRAFRDTLWRHHLGPDAETSDPLFAFRRAADANMSDADRPGDGGSFVVPWDREAVARAARRHWFMPSRYL